MDEVLEFLKGKTYFVATENGQQPELRPLGTVCKYQGKLYIQTGMKKNFFKQMVENPLISICAYEPETGTWLRLNATAVPDEGIEVCEAMLDEYPQLRRGYTPGDGNMVVIELRDATARFCSFTQPERTITF